MEDIKDFDRFWSHWPKKVGKKEASAAWLKKLEKKELPSIDYIISRLNSQKFHREICARKGVFCPQWPDPVRWIKHERWGDEVVNNEASWRVIKQSVADRARAAADNIAAGLVATSERDDGCQVVATVGRAE